MRASKYLAVLMLVFPAVGQTDALFGNEMAGDRKLPRTFGVGIDYFSMDQPYQFDSLSFSPPVLPITDPNIIGVESDMSNVDLKFDVWVFPFLNVFAIYGNIDGETDVDLSDVGLPIPPLNINYDGDVYGGGLTLAVGGDRWFASITSTFTDTDLSGDFDSSVKATTIQPRVGMRVGDRTEIWIGGYFIDAEESHNGSIELDLGPGLGGVIPLDFAVELSQEEDFNLSIGAHVMLTDAWEATLEVGDGDRNTLLGNLTYRFR